MFLGWITDVYVMKSYIAHTMPIIIASSLFVLAFTFSIHTQTHIQEREMDRAKTHKATATRSVVVPLQYSQNIIFGIVVIWRQDWWVFYG